MNKKTMNKMFLITSLLTISPIVSKAESVYMCEPCPAGYACSNGVKTICPAGTFATAGAKTCTKCPAGTYSGKAGATSSLACQPCPDYQWSDAGSPKCGQVFVAVTLTGYKANWVVNKYITQWANIESFVDNRYCPFGTHKYGFLMTHKNGFQDPDNDYDYGNFGFSPTIALTREGDGSMDFLKGDCKTFPCILRGGISSRVSATIDPKNNNILQIYSQGGSQNISNAIKVVYDTYYKNSCFGPK